VRPGAAVGLSGRGPDPHRRLAPDGAPALYASLNEVVGAEINGWAAGNVEDWAEAMECALRCAETTDDPQIPHVAHAATHARLAGGLRQLIDHVRANADDIRARRTANGLENRESTSRESGNRFRASRTCVIRRLERIA
jgi:hypothetical protein